MDLMEIFLGSWGFDYWFAQSRLLYISWLGMVW